MAITPISTNKFLVTGLGNILAQTWSTLIGGAGSDEVTLNLPSVTSQGYIDFRAATVVSHVHLNAPGTWNLKIVGARSGTTANGPTITGNAAQNINLQVDGSLYFVTDGSITTFNAGAGVRQVTYTTALIESTLNMRNGAPSTTAATLAVFEDAPWAFAVSQYNYIAAFDLETGGIVNLGTNGNYGGVRYLTNDDEGWDSEPVAEIETGSYGIALDLTDFTAEGENLAVDDNGLYFVTNAKGVAVVVDADDNTTDYTGLTTRGGNSFLEISTAADVAIDGDLRIYAGKANSVLYADFNPVFIGTDGNDAKTSYTFPPTLPAALYGFGGNDILVGTSYADTIFGGEGNDILTGNGGADALYGDGGPDQFNFASRDQLTTAATIVGGANSDRIVLTGAASLVDSDFSRVSTVEIVRLYGDSTVQLGTQANNAGIGSIIAGSGDTSIQLAVGASLTVDVGAMLDNKTLTTLGSGSWSVINLAADLVNTAPLSLDIYMKSTNGGSSTVTSDGATSVTIINNTLATGDTLRLAGGDGKTVTSLVGNLVLDNSNTGFTHVTSTGTTGFSVTAGSTSGAFSIDAANLADNALLTVAGGSGAVTDSVSHLQADLVATTEVNQLEIGLANAADDTISLVAGTNGMTVTGGDASDTVTLTGLNTADQQFTAATALSFFNVTGNSDAQRITGSDAGNTLTGGGGADTLTGGAGADFFNFVSGAELGVAATVVGGGNIDTLVFTVAEADVADLDFTKVSSVEKVQLAAGGNTADFGALAAAAGIATLIGGSGIDRLSIWNALAVTVTGGAGQDVFAAGNTSQMTITDLALDNLQEVVTTAAGSTVNATLAGNWTATAGTGNNAATYAGFTVNTHALNVNLALATGSGYKVVGTGAASVVGSAGADYLQTGNNTDYGDVTLTGGAGVDDFYVLSGAATITDLGNGADLFQVEGPAVLDATLVSDWTATSDSWRQPGSGSVTLRVGNAYNLNLSAVNFGVGFTMIKTGTGTIRGTQMADEIRVLPGGSGNLYGNLGADLFNNQGINSGSMIIQDLGLNNESDSIINGASWISPGATVYAYTAGNWTATSTTINNNSANTFMIRAQNTHSVNLSLASVSNAAISGYSVMSMGTGAIVGSNANDVFYKDQGGNAQFTGGLGVDTFRSVSSNGFIMTITDLGFNGEADIVIVTAGSVTEATVVANWTATSQTLNQGTATLTGTAVGNHIDLSEANGGTLGFTINADAATASAITGSLGNDTINGSSGNDTLVGGAGDDSLTGGSGNNIINGGVGNDTINLTDGGNDLFNLATATLFGATGTSMPTTVYLDTVTGFAQSADAIQLGIGNLATTATASITFSNGNGIEIAATALGGSTVTTAAVNATVDAATAGSSIIKFTSTTATSFETAIGTGSITIANFANNLNLAGDAGAAESLAVIWYDSANSRMVISAFVASNADTALDAADGANVVNIAVVGMSSADYTAMATGNFSFA